MFSLICLVLSGCICLSSGYSIYHSCRRLSGHLHNSHFNPFKSEKPNHNNRLHYFSYTVIPYSIRGPFCIYLTVFLVVFFFRLFLVACALSLSHSLCLSAHCCSPLSFFQRATGFVYPTKSGKEEEEIAAANVACIFRLTVEYFRFLFRSNQYCCQKTVVRKSGIRRRGERRGRSTEILSLSPWTLFHYLLSKLAAVATTRRDCSIVTVASKLLGPNWSWQQTEAPARERERERERGAENSGKTTWYSLWV